MKFAKVKENPGLVRDLNSGAIININSNELEAARQRKQDRKNNINERQQMKNDITQLKQDVSNITNLLQQLIEKS